MSLAVTGATGNLGRLVIDDLFAAGVPSGEIVAVVRNPAKAADLAERGVDVRVADYADPTALREALAGVHRLLLISSGDVGQRLGHHTNVIEAARANGVRHVAYTSIIHADTSHNPLAEEHAATEKVLIASGLGYTILRNAWYVEIYTNQLPAYLESGEIVGATGDGQISAAPRADFATATATALASGGEESRILELGGPAFTLTDLARTITDVTGTPVTHRDLAPADFVSALRAQGYPEAGARMVADVDASIAAGEMYTDSPALEQLMGRPATPLVDSVQKASRVQA